MYCKSSFKSKEALLIHKEMAHRNIRCEHCNKLFIRQEHLSRHINKEHVKIFPDLICKECKLVIIFSHCFKLDLSHLLPTAACKKLFSSGLMSKFLSAIGILVIDTNAKRFGCYEYRLQQTLALFTCYKQDPVYCMEFIVQLLKYNCVYLPSHSLIIDVRKFIKIFPSSNLFYYEKLIYSDNVMSP